MNENVETMVLEHLRLIRTDIARVEQTLTEKVDDLDAKVDGVAGTIIGLGHYIHAIDHRVEQIEEKIGGDA
ncbi:hypothetical protein [Jannaschia sp. LMIT008]|uniref:hypothetical protein n=1 Tax=Jannaschia maritima TaxID=3032585 RepID=UPI002812599E|nr:hypothetical protein [Jannaschia sp. LMIT008]